MNRQQRRLQNRKSKGNVSPQELSKALSSLESLQQLGELTKKLNPYLENIEQLSKQLEDTTQALQKAEAELKDQRTIFLHLFATGMGISVAEVLSMEAQIRERIKNADETTGAEEESTETQADSSPRPPGRLEETLTKSDPEGTGNSGSAA